MKTITSVIAVLMISTSVVFAQQCPVPTPLDMQKTSGTWTGYYTFNGNMEEITVEITNVKEVLKVIVSIPKQSVNRIEFNSSVCESQEIHFKAPIGRYAFEFIGTPKDKIFKGEIIINDLTGKTGEEIFVLKK